MDLNAIESWLKPEEQVGLNNCDREPIHIPGSIQPHGAMCALGPDDTIVVKSENLDAYFGMEGVASQLEQELLKIQTTDGERFAIQGELCGRRTAIITHRLNSLRVFEFEPCDERIDVPNIINLINQTSNRLSGVQTRQDAFEIVVKKVRELTGFDRVLAYVFDKEGHGEVVAAAVSDGVEDFLNLRFPSTDIPKQARRLYTLELTRQIVDVSYEPVPLSPQDNPFTKRPLNMMFCQLRSVSPIHVKYLKNMGVSASFSVSVVVNGQLHALIACHHYAPRRLDISVRQACELLGRMLAQFFASQEEQSRRQARSRQLAAQVELLCELGERDEVNVMSKAWANAASFVEAESMIVKIGDDIKVHGEPLSDEEHIVQVGSRLAQETPQQIRATNNLGEYESQSPGGGLIVVPVPDMGWIGWYREPEDRLVQWAGDPKHDATKDLNPRSSFALWQERVRGYGRAWEEEDIDMAEILRRGLYARFSEAHESEDSFERAMSQLREYVLYLEENTQALNRVNDDLRQFAYAASHDLRAPLRTVRSFLPLIRKGIEDQGQGDGMLGWLDYVENAADTLHRLQEGLWAFSRVNRVTQTDEIELEPLFKNLIKSLAADYEGVSVVMGDLPTIEGVLSQVETLFRNLLDNASKYRSPDRPLQIVIDAYKEKGEWVITVSDNGIGFPPSSSERIFDLFTRVHSRLSVGDGLGLALCRRIAHHHNGWIRASSEPDLGSTFEVCLRTPTISQ